MKQEVVFYQRESFIYIVAAFISVFLSVWMNLHETVINRDAICYVLSAEAMGRSSIQAAMHECPQAKWPFYSMLIYGLSNMTSLSYVVAAYFLDGVFSIISVLAFLAILKELSHSTRLMWLGLFVIVCSHQFNSVRQYIIRDHGFWALYLVSLFFLLQYFRHFKRADAFFWGGSLAAATLFRIEGAIFLMGLPFLSWFFPRQTLRQRLGHFVTLNIILFFVCASMVGWMLIHPHQTVGNLGRIQEVVNQFEQGLLMMLDRYQGMKAQLILHVLSYDAVREAGLVLALTICVWYLVNVLSNLSWIYSLLVLYAWRSKAAILKQSDGLVLASYLFVNFLITFTFFVEHSFLSKRYLIAFSLVLMLWVPFALDRLLLQANRFRARSLFAGVATLIFISLMSSMIHFGYSKAYIRDAGIWIAQNVPDKASIYMNDSQLMYYSSHYRNDFFSIAHRYTHADSLSHGQWKQYHYIAFHLNKQDDAKVLTIMQEIPLMPVKEFANARGDKVVIFKVKETVG